MVCARGDHHGLHRACRMVCARDGHRGPHRACRMVCARDGHHGLHRACRMACAQDGRHDLHRACRMVCALGGRHGLHRACRMACARDGRHGLHRACRMVCALGGRHGPHRACRMACARDGHHGLHRACHRGAHRAFRQTCQRASRRICQQVFRRVCGHRGRVCPVRGFRFRRPSRALLVGHAAHACGPLQSRRSPVCPAETAHNSTGSDGSPKALGFPWHAEFHGFYLRAGPASAKHCRPVGGQTPPAWGQSVRLQRLDLRASLQVVPLSVCRGRGRGSDAATRLRAAQGGVSTHHRWSAATAPQS